MYTTNRKSRIIMTLFALFLVLSCAPLSQVKETVQDGAQAAIEQIGEESTKPEATAAQSASTQTVPRTSEVRYEQPFADYQQIDVSLPDTFQGGYALPLDLNTVQGVDSFDLSSAQLDMLAENGFVVAAPDIEASNPEFYHIYEYYRYEEQPVFATTDAVFHVYHLMFDKILRNLEREYFSPALEELTLAMLNTSREQYQSLTGTPLEEPARRNLAFFSVAAQLLEIQDAPPAEVSDLVEAELALIDSHSIPAESPIWFREDLPADKRLTEDYSQYIPRGHYTRSEALERYFKAMMWYGRLTFRLRDDFETQRALLITRALQDTVTAGGEAAATLWANIFEPVTFLVGKIDDPSYHEYRDLAGAVFGPDCVLTDYADTALLEEFTRQANELPPPQVNSMWVWIWEDKEDATRGFRFMGQRFTLDEYIFGQLMWRNVGTMDNQRSLPKGLDVFAAMGSDEAYVLLDEMGETEYENYDSQMSKVKSEVSALELDSWTQNLYWSWLYAFQPIIEPKDERYPAFMQTQAWQHKDLQTALGSWTELKHDTILYAKQVMAEMGGGGMEPTHGYVEPNPQAFARLYALAKMTYDGLESRSLLDANSAGNLQNLMDLLSFLTGSAEKELQGEPLSDDDYWRIHYFGGELEALTIAAADAPGEEGRLFLQDQRAALIADVATGSGAALEEAVGDPTPIYVVLPDQPWRLAIGAVYTYYEFNVSSDQRMTDEAWYEMLDSGNNPAQPAWTDSYSAP